MDQMLGRHGETCVVSVCGQVDQPFDQLECYRRRRGTWHSIDVARVHYTLTRVVADQSNLTEMNGAAFLSLHLDASVFIQAIRQGKAHADLGAQSLDDHSAFGHPCRVSAPQGGDVHLDDDGILVITAGAGAQPALALLGESFIPTYAEPCG
jgi:hypothetical protein